jgi:hypothetical protein
MPIRNPRGAIRRMESSWRKKSDFPWKEDNTWGRYKAERNKRQATERRTNLSPRTVVGSMNTDRRLPNPAKTSKAKMTTETE